MVVQKFVVDKSASQLPREGEEVVCVLATTVVGVGIVRIVDPAGERGREGGGREGEGEGDRGREWKSGREREGGGRDEGRQSEGELHVQCMYITCAHCACKRCRSCNVYMQYML